MTSFDLNFQTFEPVPTGEYPATLTGVEDAEGQYGPQLRWTLDLGNVTTVEGNVQPVTLSYWTPRNPTGRNKLGRMIKGIGIDPREVTSTDQLIGKRCTITVVAYYDDKGEKRNRIEEVGPASGNAPAPAAPVSAGVDPADVPF